MSRRSGMRQGALRAMTTLTMHSDVENNAVGEKQ
jgi:hypothetical protein